jgi:S-adenosylmethionine:tRNA ribosyltransferase-isomerase
VKLSEFSYDLPAELIAQQPVSRRDASRLMLVERSTHRITHHQFSDLAGLLQPSDLLVVNNTRVIPARIFGFKKGGTARIETLLLREIESDLWEVLLKPARRASAGTEIVFVESRFEARVESSPDPMKRVLHFRYSGDFWSWIDRLGQTPLPPYIRRQESDPDQSDRERYQTVFARHRGSVAAPTAGLHFSSELLKQLRTCEITLHVGYGTFKPISVGEIEEHQMDPEYYSIDHRSACRIQTQINSGSRLIAVGTTTTRTLEHVIQEKGKIVADSGWTDLFIYPGYHFQAISGLVTNFHLPGSTLLLLVSAFGGKELIRRAYKLAVEKRYRFYSYGDAMLIL